MRLPENSTAYTLASTATPTLSPEKQALADGIMEELEVYREKQGIVLRTNSTETAVIRSQEADANRTVPTKQTKQPTSSALHRSFSTDDGGNASLRNIGAPQNASASLDTFLRKEYNRGNVALLEGADFRPSSQRATALVSSNNKHTVTIPEWMEFPEQTHHFASNKNKKYTPMFQQVISKYGLDLNDPWNKETMHHQGRHPDDYHE